MYPNYLKNLVVLTKKPTTNISCATLLTTKFFYSVCHDEFLFSTVKTKSVFSRLFPVKWKRFKKFLCCTLIVFCDLSGTWLFIYMVWLNSILWWWDLEVVEPAPRKTLKNANWDLTWTNDRINRATKVVTSLSLCWLSKNNDGLILLGTCFLVTDVQEASGKGIATAIAGDRDTDRAAGAAGTTTGVPEGAAVADGVTDLVFHLESYFGYNGLMYDFFIKLLVANISLLSVLNTYRWFFFVGLVSFFIFDVFSRGSRFNDIAIYDEMNWKYKFCNFMITSCCVLEYWSSLYLAFVR